MKKQWKHGKILKLEGSTPKGAGPLLFCPYSGVSVRFRSHVEILNLEMVSTSKIIGVIIPVVQSSVVLESVHTRAESKEYWADQCAEGKDNQSFCGVS